MVRSGGRREPDNLNHLRALKRVPSFREAIHYRVRMSGELWNLGFTLTTAAPLERYPLEQVAP